MDSAGMNRRMRVLVTGHKGYVGAVLVPMLLDRGHEVVGCDVDFFAECTYCGRLADVPDLARDVRELDADELTGLDAVVHLAGLSNDPLGYYRPALTDAINNVAAVRVARAAKRAGVRRYVFASSCSNYGQTDGALVDERAEFNPLTPYGMSKVDAEREIGRLADERFSPIQLRAGTVYGVSPRIRFDLVLNNLIAWAHTTGRVHLKSDGAAWRPLVHVEDVARAYVAVLEAPRERVHNEAFNVGRTDENYRVRDLAAIVLETVPGSRLETAPDAAADARNYRVDCGKIANALPSWRPQWTVRRGAQELYETFRRVGLEQHAFEGPRFNRIAHLRGLIEQGLLDADLHWTSAHRAAVHERT